MMRWLLPIAALFAFSACAADVSGTWKGTADTPNGKSERTFVFKVDGNKVTGETTSQMMGKSTIMDGKLEGRQADVQHNDQVSGSRDQAELHREGRW
jgi:hypothetical protein